MPIAAGSRLGPYEILAPLGAGGMGEVFRARDARLERTVAIKILPQNLSASAESRQRFEREAKTISQLSHPHICALYDVGREGEVEYLVMEYLEGETLSSRLARGPLPADQTLRFGREIAEALDKAHRQGIVHRDLKPANVMLTGSGVKLLDFGLAKAVVSAAPASGVTALPTMQGSPNLTQEGTILGTFQYMAPEQLEGKETDGRADIFALGSVLYEMATGLKAFAGSSQASLIGAILHTDPPPVSSVQPLSPPGLDRVVKTCLSKDPEDRWQSAADLKRELQWIAEGSGSAAAPPALARSRGGNGWKVAAAVAGGIAVFAATAAIVYLLRRPPPRVVRFTIPPPLKALFDSEDGPAAISPDGRRIVFAVNEADGRWSLWTRSLEELDPRPLEGSDQGYDPFWSPDSRFVAFGSLSASELRRVDPAGGPVQRICEITDGRGGTWNRDNVILFSPNGGNAPIYRVPASGGAPVPATTLDVSHGETGHWRPKFLPDGHHFLFLIQSKRPGQNGLAIGSLDSKEIRRVPGIDVSATWAPPGFLLFVRQGRLMAQPFDSGNLRLSGDAFPVASDVGYVPIWGSGAFSVSNDGILVSQAGGRPDRQLAWFDRAGNAAGRLGEIAPYDTAPRFSPDGRRVAVARNDPETRAPDIWTVDVARGVETRLTFEPSLENEPVWSPDGQRIAFGSNRDGVKNLYVMPAGGAGSQELLLKTDQWKNLCDWSPDGSAILYTTTDPATKDDLWTVPVSGERKPKPFIATPFEERSGRYSGDGRHVVYVSDENGKKEVYVQTFPASGVKWQISVGGGTDPVWPRGGKEIFYVGPDQHLKAVEVRAGASGLEVSAPKDLFQMPMNWGYDVTPDGQRFLLNIPSSDAPIAPINVVLNWTSGLPRR